MATNIEQLAEDRRIVGVVAYTPAGEEEAFTDLLPGCFRLLTQRGTDLGERLCHAAEDLFAVGFGAVCLINSDSPTLPQSLLANAAAELRSPGERAVLGEATDGGYYLIGLKKLQAHLFHAIDWSTSRVFAQTLARAREVKLDMVTLPLWYDVDDLASLRTLLEELRVFGDPGPGRPIAGYPAPITAQFVRELAIGNGALGQLVAETRREPRVS